MNDERPNKRPAHDVTGARPADETAPEPGGPTPDAPRQGQRAPGLYRKVIVGVLCGFAAVAVAYAFVV